MLLGRRERKELCRPLACPENPLELVLVCLNNSAGFFAQTVARFEGECQGTATPCRETLVVVRPSDSITEECMGSWEHQQILQAALGPAIASKAK